MTKISFLFFYIQAPIREKAHRIKIRQSVKTKTPQVDLTLVSGNGSSHLRESKDILANYKYIINNKRGFVNTEYMRFSHTHIQYRAE